MNARAATTTSSIPFTQSDYYSLSAFFNSIDEYGLYNDTAHVPTPSLLLPTPEQKKAMRATADRIEERGIEFARAAGEAEPAFQQWLARTNLTAEIPGLAASFKFDALTAQQSLSPSGERFQFQRQPRRQQTAPGNRARPIQFTGDDELSFPASSATSSAVDSIQRLSSGSTFPKSLTNAVIFHRESGTDVGFHGTN